MIEEPLTPVDAAAQLSFAVQEVLGRVAATHDMSVTLVRMLGILRDHEPTMAALADSLGLDRSSVTGLIDRAEKRGLVARHPSATDARSVLVTLTAAGRRLSAAGERDFEEGMRGILSRLSDADTEALVRIGLSLRG